jgi:hypothetical protein
MPFKIDQGQLFFMQNLLLPNLRLYSKEKEVLAAMVEEKETYVPAANMMGKDFTVGLGCFLSFVICLYYQKTCRIVNTSVAEHHLKAVWGEIGRFVRTAKWPDGRSIEGKDWDQINVNHMEIRYAREAASKNPLSYLAGRTAKDNGEGLAGHHADFTMAVGDEASGLRREVHEMFQGWAQHIVYIGNCNQCQNQFRDGVKAGSKPSERIKVIRITAEDSPNVIAKRDDAFPGVLTYSEYLWRRRNWDKVRQCIGLDAQFYEGAENLLHPPDWLNRAEQLARDLGRDGKGSGHWGYERISLGVDPAEGGDKSAFCVGDRLGIIDLQSISTPMTTDVSDYALYLMKRYKIKPEDVCFDSGGGGKQHADILRKYGYNVRTVGFGEGVTLDVKHGVYSTSDRRENREERQEYVNRRAQMGGEFRELLDPVREDGFAIPANLRGKEDDSETNLRDQLAPIPLMYKEGRLALPPKHKPNPNYTGVTLVGLIGHSPDEYDALLLQTHALLHKSTKRVAGRVA